MDEVSVFFSNRRSGTMSLGRQSPNDAIAALKQTEKSFELVGICLLACTPLMMIARMTKTTTGGNLLIIEKGIGAK